MQDLKGIEQAKGTKNIGGAKGTKAIEGPCVPCVQNQGIMGLRIYCILECT